MKIVLLGTSGYHPNGRRHTACMMIPELGIVLDAGSAMYRVRDYLCTDELDIFLSHVHLDHVMGLTFLFDVLHEKDVRRVTVHGAEEKLAAVRKNLLADLIFPAKLPCQFQPLAARTELPEGGTLTHFPLIHPGGSLGFRLDWPGHSLAYVTDTTASLDAAYIDHLRGVDLLLHECNFPDGMEELARVTGHSCTTPVAVVARAADVERLVLVHLNPLSEAADPIGLHTAQAIFPRTILGEDLMTLEF